MNGAGVDGSCTNNIKDTNNENDDTLYYELNGTMIRIKDEQVELFVASTGSWTRMNFCKSVNVPVQENNFDDNCLNDCSRDQDVISCEINELSVNRINNGANNKAITECKANLMFSTLFSELIVHILSFLDYYSIPIFPDFNLNIREFFGRLPDGSIKALYLNIKVPWVFSGKEISGDALICIYNARCLKFDAVPLLSKLHLMAPFVESVHLGYVTTFNQIYISKNFACYDKIRTVVLSGDAVRNLVPKLVNIKDLYIEDVKISLSELKELISECKSEFLHLCNISIVESKTFPIALFKANPYVKHLELLFDSNIRYSMNLLDLLQIDTLKSVYCNLSEKELIALSKSHSVENIAIYSDILSEALFSELGKSKIVNVKVYIRPNDVYMLSYLLQSMNNLRSIELFDLHYLDDNEKKYTLGHMLRFHNIMQKNSNILIKNHLLALAH
jgi:hypothetical protein